MLIEIINRGQFVEGRDWLRRSFAENEVILREGQRSGKVFVVLQGRLQVIASVDFDGRAIRPGFKELEPGDIFGELALLERAPHSATVTAISAGELAQVEADALAEFLEKHPETGHGFYRYLCEILVGRLQQTNRKMLSLLAWGLKAHGYEEHLK